MKHSYQGLPVALLLIASAVACGAAATPVASTIPTKEPAAAPPTAAPTQDIEATVEARLRATVSAMPAATPPATVAPEPTPVLTSTPPPEPTSPPLPTPTDEPTPTLAPTPTSTPIPPPTQDPTVPVFGPKGGSLTHDPDEDTCAKGGKKVREDVVVQATFFNPHSAREGRWVYGIKLLSADESVSHNIRFHSVGRVDTRFKIGSADRVLMDLPNTSFEWNSGRRNLVRIVAIEEKGWLFVNGSFVSTLKLTGLSGKMTLRVCVYSVRDLVIGESTKYTGFTI